MKQYRRGLKEGVLSYPPYPELQDFADRLHKGEYRGSITCKKEIWRKQIGKRSFKRTFCKAPALANGYCEGHGGNHARQRGVKRVHNMGWRADLLEDMALPPVSEKGENPNYTRIWTARKQRVYGVIFDADDFGFEE
jgi:hypothetical protein